MKTFKHNLKKPTNIIEAQQIMGYILCLRNLYKKLEEMTENFKPEKRFVDASELLDMTSATTDELLILINGFGKLEEKDVTAEVINQNNHGASKTI